jgi:hypothetical protein
MMFKVMPPEEEQVEGGVTEIEMTAKMVAAVSFLENRMRTGRPGCRLG